MEALEGKSLGNEIGWLVGASNLSTVERDVHDFINGDKLKEVPSMA